MDCASSEGSGARFAAYVEALGTALGHADRQEPMRDYCLGLLMPITRKSVEPMAAVTAPAQVAAKHQSLLHFVGNAPWSDAAMLAKVGELVLPAIERSGPIEAWIIDDTGFPKKGQHSGRRARPPKALPSRSGKSISSRSWAPTGWPCRISRSLVWNISRDG
jgi:SRSO17 transposase